MNTNGASEKERFFERFFAWGNDIIDKILGHPWISLAVVLTMTFVVVTLVILLIKNQAIVLEKIGPFKILKSSLHKRFPRRITTLPAPKPRNPGAELPSEILALAQELKKGQRKHILIQCGSQSQVEELGKLLYHKLEKEKTCDHIGWLHYEKGETGKPLIEERIDQEFSIYTEIEEYDVRRTKRLDFLDDCRRHTVLFVNVITYQQEKDYVLERYNNFKGLSMILLSRREIEGFETYSLARKREELSCSSKK